VRYPADASLARIREQLLRMRAIVQSPRLLDAKQSISNWSPAEHIDHSVKVALSIVNRLTKPEPVERPLSFLGRAVLYCNWIPRGRGRSPAKLHGARETPLVLETALTKLEERLASVSAADVDAARMPVVPHPRFGGLTPQQALRFLAIHTEHHLKIVAEILGAR
jgi:DinB superfamily